MPDSCILTFFTFWQSQFFNSIAKDMGVAGVIDLIEYGEFGIFYGNFISFSFFDNDTFSI
jgi:hypothetical protein